MKYRPLGNTGIKVSEIGFGTWGLSGGNRDAIAYGRTDDSESILALKKAFNLGVTFYDTAALYGFGHSEKLLGKTFKKKREQIIIASKVGFVDFSGKQVFSPKYIRKSLIKSLKNLQTDYLDLYQLHGPSIKLLKARPAILQTMIELKNEGLIRSFGISAQSPSDALQMAESFDVDCLQVNFNLSDQRVIENGLFPQSKKHKIGLIVRTPLCFGFLAEKTQSSQFDKGDHRRRFSSDQIDRWNKAYPLFEKELRRKGCVAAQNSLRFCLSFPTVSTVIPGMLNRKHVKENTSASLMPKVSATKLKRIHKIYMKHLFFKSS
jgi:aryl-alcohol dehydrogenase-like predicted oxidoreductase